MNHPTFDTEERMLRSVLGREADRVTGGSDLDRVRTRARGIRRRRRATTACLAAAAIVAVTVPSAVLLHQGTQTPPPSHQGTPQPSPSQTGQPSPTRAPSPTKSTNSAPAIDDLASIPRGPGTFLGYVGADGVVHSNGSTGQLPGTMDPSTQFLSYKGGWLVAGADNKLREYDSTGKLVTSGLFGGMAVTDDRTQAAWVMGGRLYQDGLSTMGNGNPQGVPVPASAALIGFLPQGPALGGTDGSIRIATGPGSLKTVALSLFPTTTSQAADLVGGSIGTPAQGNVEGAVYDLKSHTQLWHTGWEPLRFSDDGSLVAAFPAAENGDPSAIAILDARTGRVIARTPKLKGLYLGRNVAWDQHRVVIPTGGAKGTQEALLSLDTSGKLTRASDVEHSTKPGGAYLIFATQP